MISMISPIKLPAQGKLAGKQEHLIPTVIDYPGRLCGGQSQESPCLLVGSARGARQGLTLLAVMPIKVLKGRCRIPAVFPLRADAAEGDQQNWPNFGRGLCPVHGVKGLENCHTKALTILGRRSPARIIHEPPATLLMKLERRNASAQMICDDRMARLVYRNDVAL